MNLEAFIPVASTDEGRRFAFLRLVYEKTRAGRMFFYDTPCYHAPERGLSIVIAYAGGYDYLEPSYQHGIYQFSLRRILISDFFKD